MSERHPWTLCPRCPLRGPKNKIAQKMVRKWFWAFPNDLPKKWSKNGLGIFWAFPNDLPKKWSKSAQKVVQKWPQQDLGTKTVQRVVKKLSKNGFWQIEVAAFGRRAHFWLSICQKPKPNLCFYGPGFCRDPFLNTFWALFDHFLGMSFGRPKTTF